MTRTHKRKSEKYYQDQRARTARAKARKQAKAFQEKLPQVTEQDLLSFQFAHFGDDSKPVEWFVDAEAALNCQPEYVEEDDGLGYYEDGVKRTLTDEQIEIFRQSELWHMEREAERRPVLSSKSNSKQSLPTIHSQGNLSTPNERMGSSSPEPNPADGDKNLKDSQLPRQPEPRNASTWKERRSREQVPFGERNKRNWEQFIDSKDAIEGALTHRRIARELDNVVAGEVNLDY